MTEPFPVVLIAYHFPPTREVGGLRAAKVARAFLDAGHRVTVIRAPSADDSAAPPFPPHPNLTIETVRPDRSPRDLYAGLKARLTRRRAPGPKAIDEDPPTWKPPVTVNPLKRMVYALMWLPDDTQGFIGPARRAALAALDREPNAVLYSTAPPASGHLAARGAAARRGARWAAEFRDPWTDNPGKPWYARTRLTDRFERWLERRCLRRADLVISVSGGIDRLMRAKVPESAGAKFVVVHNGIDRLAGSAPSHGRNKPVRIVHVGTLYLGRDPRPFLEALARVITRRRLGAADLQVEFVGEAEYFDGLSVQSMVDRLHLGELVRLTGWMPHGEARARIDSADALLLLARGQPLQIPNKLYEYLGSRRPIIVVADREGETAELARRIGGHWIVSGDGEELEAAIDAAIDGPGSHGPDEDRLVELSAEREMARLLSAVRLTASSPRRANRGSPPSRSSAG